MNSFWAGVCVGALLSPFLIILALAIIGSLFRLNAGETAERRNSPTTH